MGKQALGLGFGVVGGLVGGLFTAGAFSGVGFGIGMSIGGLVLGPDQKRGKGGKAPTIDGTQVPFYPREVLGTVGNITPQIIQTGRDSAGNAAGVMVVSGGDAGGIGCGGGGSYQGDRFYITLAIYFASTLQTGPVFCDEIAVEDSDGPRLLWNRFGTTSDTRGFELVPQFRNGELIAEVSEGLRLYPGSALQMPDTALQELWGREAGAYRLSAYCVLNKVEFHSVPTFKFTLRSALTNRRTIIRRRLRACGIPAERINLTRITGDIQGASITSPTSARDFCEKLAMPVFCQLVFSGEQIVDADAQNPDILDVDESQMGARAGGKGGRERGDVDDVERIERRAAEDTPSETTLPFSDKALNYDSNEAFAVRGTASYTNSQSIDTAGEVGDLSGSVKVARAKLDEAGTADRTWRTSLLPEFAHVLPGDVLRVHSRPPGRAPRTRLYRINEREREPNGILNVAGLPWNPRVFYQPGVLNTPQRAAPQVLVPGAPVVFVCETAPILDAMAGAPGMIGAACAQSGQPFRRVVFDTQDTSHVTLTTPAQIGEVVAEFDFVPGQAFDYGRTLKVRMWNGTPQSASEAAVRDGANRLLLDTGRIVSFVQATPSGPGQWTLSGIRDGEYGTDAPDGDYDITQSVPPGARVLLLTDSNGKRNAGPQFLKRPKSAIGKAGLQYRIEPDGGAQVWTDYVLRGENLKPPAPVQIVWTHEAGGAARVRGHARNRVPDDEAWSDALDGVSDPLTFDIWLDNGAYLNHIRKVASGPAFDLTVSPGELSAMFGSAPDRLTGWIAQASGTIAGRRAFFADPELEPGEGDPASGV